MDNKRTDLTQYKESWARASTFPVTKELSYPELVVVQEFGDHHGKEVLEYGCGAGSDALSYFRRGNYVTCVDIVPENLYAARCNIEQAGFLRDAEFKLLEYSYPLPFPDNSFDLVNSNGVIHHIPDGPKVVAEFLRVLRPGGLVYLMLYTENLKELFQEKMVQLQKEHGISEEESFCWCTDAPGTPYAIHYTDESGRKMLTDIGFEVVKTQMYNRKQFREFKGMKPKT